MAPKPDVRTEFRDGPNPGDAIVISGIAGLFPNSRNVKQFSDILYNKINPIVNSTRWETKHPEVSQYAGTIPDVACFDAQFFKVHYRLGRLMEPMSRKMLEQTYQALFDAGCNPESLSGKKIGVFVGNCFSESEKATFYGVISKTGLGIAGCSRSMFANRISYYLNLKGPSVSIDESCCSSSAALEMAYDAIARGECEAALVGGCNLCLHPQTSVHYGRAINICMDGKTKSFDANADGCSKSEAINIIFLQKAKDALRIYAYVVYAKCEYLSLPECETGAKYGFNRNPRDIVRFLKKFYEEAKVYPSEVQYIEAFGAATKDTDKLEIDVIDEVFCEDRKEPLKVGSVMSNIGYVEGASGTSAITKVLLGYHYGKLSANLHYKTPRDDIAAIKEGRIEILADHKELIPTYYTAINGLSICGSFSHVLLRGFNKKKDTNKYKSNLPRIVLCSGRQESSVIKIIEDLKSRPVDPEELALLHHFYESNVPGHLGRGYVILDTNEEMETVCVSEQYQYFDQGRRLLWFVYSGMGSQWTGMGKDLMRIPLFAGAIERCHRVLEPKGLNLIDIITSDDPKIFDNILHSFVGIAAVQIGLTDVLKAMDIVPDMMIGHSVGEIGCAYADGCFTAEETILCAYSRGLVSVQTPLIRGSMAAVGLGYKEMSKLCPPEVDVACHNSASSCTISGPADVMSQFVANLVRQGIFAKEVPCSNIAYHSRYIADAGPALLKYMKEVIPEPRERSPRWLSTSVPQAQWDEPSAKYSSAEYFTNNLLSPVLFEETSQQIPADAVLVEVAPHGLLQAILKRSLPTSCNLLPLTQRKHPQNSKMLLEAIGRLYMEGFLPKVKAMYPKVEFPVSTSTPMLSHLVEWVYQEEWDLLLPSEASKITAAERSAIVSTYDAKHSYLKGHVIRGTNHYPFSAALVLVWDTLATSLNVAPKDLSVQFDNVYFHSQPIMHKKHQLRIHVSVHKGEGKFEVLNENSLMIRGIITAHMENQKEVQYAKTHEFTVSTEDIYRLMYAKEYEYDDEFRSIQSADESLTEANIVWRDNWVAFLDGIIQLNVLRRKHNAISKLNFIRRIVINVDKHYANVKDHQSIMFAKIMELHDITICGGVTIESLKFADLPQCRQEALVLGTPKESASGEHLLPLEDSIDPKRGAMLKIGQVGDFDSLYWVEDEQNNDNALEVKVHYAGLNNVFVGKLLGQQPLNLDHNNSIIDFSGVARSGTRVMGLVRGASLSSRVTSPDLLLPVPAHWTMEEAATVPLAYALAIYILFIKTNITETSTILVQGGAGSLGQALISTALAHGCQVFTTVSTTAKKQFLRKLFPGLKSENIIKFSSDLRFVDKVLNATNGKGCEVIVCQAKGEQKNFTLQCLASKGYVVDTTVINSQEDYYLGMNFLNLDRSYVLIDISNIFDPKYAEDVNHIRDLMVDGIRSGFVRPLSRVTYRPEEVVSALRMQAGYGCGRVLLDLRQLVTNILPRFSCSSSSWQVIISEHEILALKIAEKLVQHGAKKIILALENVSRCSSVRSRIWRNEGVTTEFTTTPLNNIYLPELIKNLQKGCPIERILVVTNKISADVISNVNNLALASKSCSLKHFAFITFSDQFTKQETTVNGINETVTVIKLPKIKLELVSGEERGVSMSAAVEVIEKALCSPQKVIVAHTSTIPRPTLLEQLLKLADLSPKDINASNDMSLKMMNLDNFMVSAIQSYLQDVYDVCLNINQIKELTIDSISDLEKQCIEFDFVDNQGIGCYFLKLYTDELVSTTDVMFLPSLATASGMNDNDITVAGLLCVVPGVEGHHSRFAELCARLMMPVLVLQPGVDRPAETVAQQARRHVRSLANMITGSKTFQLLGYEFGVLVALEMAEILEEAGLTGKVFCVGGSPTEVLSHFKNNLKAYQTNEELQMGVVKHAYSLVSRGDPGVLDSLGGLEWRDKVDKCTDELRKYIPSSIQYTKKWLDHMYAKLTLALQCTPKVKQLRSQIVSLRPQYDTSIDTSLQKYSVKEVVSYQLKAPLSLAAQDLVCGAIVNRHLDNNIHKNFNKKNISHSHSFLNMEF